MIYDGIVNSGKSSITFDTKLLPIGVYFIKMTTNSVINTGKLVVY